MLDILDDFNLHWIWEDPANFLGVVSVAANALIPFLLWRVGSKQEAINSKLNEAQARSLHRQESLISGQRRDSLLDVLGWSSSGAHLKLLWKEIHGFQGSDRDLLLAAFRANPAVVLPGTSSGVKIPDEISASAIEHYIDGLERRYSMNSRIGPPYPGLLQFLNFARERLELDDVRKVIELVTGPTLEIQTPDHRFYADLVKIAPGSVYGLLRSAENIDRMKLGFLRINVITGTLQGVREMAGVGSFINLNISDQLTSDLKKSASDGLGWLLHRGALRDMDRWSRIDETSEPVSATVAWLIWVVGWAVGGDNHASKRLVENLPAAIRAIPKADRQWGADANDVRQGFEWIERKCPALWGRHALGLESAATEIGPWRP